ncbi:MAG: hypothetical protein NT120_03040 [Candidatus Aenigmarchaeota archaeon]|nr:hypothetical protein [Candidatus Aenigmarchaeota archaeon]
METKNLLKRLEGIHTINTVMDTLGISKGKAIYYIYRLRKRGYVKTKRLNNNTRVYYISFENKLEGFDYREIINTYSPVKISTAQTYKIYGKEPTLEETLIYAIKTGSLRTILAALALFKKINNWSELYRLSKENRIERQVGALYDLARKIMRTRRMTKKFRTAALPKEQYNFVYIVPDLKSKDFNDIETVWKVYLPFNQKDLEDYR